jgi:hypothetical protein
MKWQPIAQLSEEEQSYPLRELELLRESWLETKNRLKTTSQNGLVDFEAKLNRRWSIETGIIERIYDIDRGTTQILVERGFLADYIERSVVTPNPEALVTILRDHYAAIELIKDFIAQSRELTLGFVHELHSMLNRHQNSVKGIDQFGNSVELQLRKGAFKLLPNNPQRQNGSLHLYCPPEQVVSEMINLIDGYKRNEKTNAIVLSAWFHHRFTQIHPYQDGNGRVIRALVNMILIRNNFLPIVITRDHREQYIQASEEADKGQLKPLIDLFATIEQATILDALSIKPDEAMGTTSIIERVASSIASKFVRRLAAHDTKLRNVDEIASGLQVEGEILLTNLATIVKDTLNSSKKGTIQISVMRGGPNFSHEGESTEHWYRWQVGQIEKGVGQFANFREHHYFIRTRLHASALPWLTFVVSFHHVGYNLTGVMQTIAFSEISYASTPDKAKPENELISCTRTPFVFTYQNDLKDLSSKYREWISEAFALAVRAWGEKL